ERSEMVKAPEKSSRIPRSPTPLWSSEGEEERAVLEKVREVLAWANRDFHASFDLERSTKDTLLYPFERVRAAVANVLLKRARGHRLANPGAVLWDGITLLGYKLDEFSVGPLDEVLSRLRGGPSSSTPAPPPPARLPPAPPRDSERRRRLLLQAIYEKLPEDA